MKYLLLVIYLFLFSQASYAQYPIYPVSDNYLMSTVHYGFKLGGGLATENNYDMGLTAEYEIFFPVHHSFDIGFMIQYQRYSQYYQNTSPYAPFTPGYAGVTLKTSGDYAFFSPEINIPLPFKRIPYILNVYVDAGVGYLINGEESMHKWDYSYNYPLYTVGNYDSSFGTTSNLNKLIYRLGFGFTQHAAMYGNFKYFTFTEDFTFVTGNLSTTSDFNYPAHTQYSPKNLRTIYVTFKIGYSIFHIKNEKHRK